MRRRLSWLVILLALSATEGRGQAPGASPTVQAFLFGDMLFTATEAEASEGFKIGQTVAHGNATLSERVLFFGEVSVTARNSGYSLAMERAILRYDFNDNLKISAGRFHTPISYWNTAFHHGLWLQGSVARPEAVKFGSRFIPVHFVGAMAEGRVSTSPLHYQVGVGNGRSENIAGAGDGGDVNGNRALILSASLQPTNLFGLRVGGALYIDQVPVPDEGDADERITSAHLVWDRGAVEFIAEYIAVRHEGANASTSTGSSAFFVHGGFRLPGKWRSVTPYARFEDMDIATADAVFEGLLTDYRAFVGGVRYDFSPLASLKAEYRSEKSDEGEAIASFFMQASFAIPMFGG